MAVKFAQSLQFTGESTTADRRFALSKADMLTTADTTSTLYGTLPKVYFSVCTDDGDFYVYNRNNTPSEETGRFKKIKPDAVASQVWQGIKLTGETDSEAIARITEGETPVTGDICILMTLISEEKYSYKSFVYNENRWEAMDGNYEADNVYFTNDIVTAGDYTQVGNITKTKTGTGTISAAGKSVKEVFQTIFTSEIAPTTVQPTVTITSFNGGVKEVGTEITPTYAITLNKGSYTYDSDTGVSVNNYYVKDSTGKEKVDASGSFDKFYVADNTNYYVNFTISYSDGIVPKTNLNNPYPEGQIKAGTAAKTSTSITGFRKYFYGCKTSIPETVDSTLIRSLTNSSSALNSGTTEFDLIIDEGTKRVYIAFLSSLNKTLKSVIDTGAMRANIKSRFEKSVVSVAGLNNQSLVDYDVYTYAPDTILGANTYEVTIE